VPIKQATAITFLLFASGIARAQDFTEIPAYHMHRNPLSHVIRYISTHKELLSMDAMTATAISLDVIASNRCQRIGYDLSLEDGLPNQCIEQNSGIGHHPSGAQLWGLGAAYIGFFTTINHVGYHYRWNEDGHSIFHVYWVPNVIISGMAMGNFVHAWHEGNVLAAQRSGIMK
jgi:hypothetical protein